MNNIFFKFFPEKNLNKDNLNTLLDLAFGMVDHKQIMRLIHNIGFSATTINTDINRKQVFATQTWALQAEIKAIVKKDRKHYGKRVHCQK